MLALPKQCNDSVIAVIGQNCPNLESIVLNDTGVSNTGAAVNSTIEFFTSIFLRDRLAPMLSKTTHRHHAQNGSQSTRRCIAAARIT